MKKVGVLRRIRAALDTPVLGQRHPGDQRGMALLLALVLIVMITAFVAEFNYSARVKILSASHARDDTKAYYLAKSGIRTYGLVLVVGRQMTGQRMVLDMLASVGLSLDGAGMVCRSIPFLDTAMLRFLTGAAVCIGTVLNGNDNIIVPRTTANEAHHRKNIVESPRLQVHPPGQTFFAEPAPHRAVHPGQRQ